MAKKLIIAIDGPSASGKGTVAHRLAKLLDYQWIDSGAMYRVLARKALDGGIALDDEKGLIEICQEMHFSFRMVGDMNHVLCNGRDFTTIIRSQDCDDGSSKVAVLPKVREVLVLMQQNLGKLGGVVMEGRDIGTVVFPEADVKIYMTASAEERAHRRLAQNRELGIEEVPFAEILAEIQERDLRDTTREVGPLKKADDAVEINTDGVSIDNVVEMVMDLVRIAREA